MDGKQRSLECFEATPPPRRFVNNKELICLRNSSILTWRTAEFINGLQWTTSLAILIDMEETSSWVLTTKSLSLITDPHLLVGHSIQRLILTVSSRFTYECSARMAS